MYRLRCGPTTVWTDYGPTTVWTDYGPTTVWTDYGPRWTDYGVDHISKYVCIKDDVNYSKR